MERKEFKILEIKEWSTIDYPTKTVGTASITKTKYHRNSLYLMEGVNGFEFFKTPRPITITELRINNKVVMIDDPMHWIGMQRLAESCKKRVLIGGLGLGLILHHLIKNTKATSIDVVEINKDVISLIQPLLPDDNRVTIDNDDILNYRWVHGHYDTIILDLWVKHGVKSNVAGVANYNVGIIETYLRFKLNNQSSNVFVWGSRQPEMNPAVEPVSENYLKFVKNLMIK